MSRKYNVIQAFQRGYEVSEDLSITQEPVVEHDVQDRCIQHEFKCLRGHFLIEGRWLLIEVEYLKPLHEVIDDHIG